MKAHTKTYSISAVHSKKKGLLLSPSYQRGKVWNSNQQKLLIDSILSGIDIPKLYFRDCNAELQQQGFRQEVVDGQQRLTAIFDFLDNKYSVSTVDRPWGSPVKKKAVKYSELPDAIQDQILEYELTVTTLSNATDEDVSEMFLRLQGGTPLNDQEKRNAYGSALVTTVTEISRHAFFKTLAIKNARGAFQQLAAQFMLLEKNRPCDIGSKHVNDFYDEAADLGYDGPLAKQTLRTLNALHKAFPRTVPELDNKATLITLYCVISELVSCYDYESCITGLEQWLAEFDTERLAQPQPPSEYWASYVAALVNGTSSGESVRKRFEFMLDSLLTRFPGVGLKDAARDFTTTQRKIIFRRDGAKCQLQLDCDGTEKLAWDKWHCDHKVPWSKQGPTSVDNGQVSCVPCNLKKGNSV